MDKKQLDDWTILMASGLDPLTACAATDRKDDKPPGKGCLYLLLVGLGLVVLLYFVGWILRVTQ